jgi:hypothetical protein
MSEEQLNFDKLQVSYDPNAEMWSINDILHGEIVVIRVEQFEEILKDYLLFFGYKLIKKEE